MWNDRNLIRLEGSLERLVENAFATLFRKPISAHDIAVKLARSMTTNTQPSRDSDSRPMAPDHYTIHLNPDLYKRFEQVQADLLHDLTQQMIELAARLGYRLNGTPKVAFVADDCLRLGDLTVESTYSEHVLLNTAMIKPIDIVEAQPLAAMHFLIGDQTVSLTQSVINIGRSEENTIVIDDSYVSRHHVQLRLRHGAYLLFDVQSKSGTYVNEVPVREHRLQSGDVILIGNTRLIFVVDNAPGRMVSGNTQSINPIQF